jgi:hypothetical protein
MAARQQGSEKAQAPQPVGDVGGNPAGVLDFAGASGKLGRHILDGGEQPRGAAPGRVLSDGRVCALTCKLNIGCHVGLPNAEFTATFGS